jgi:aryl-phospho-beta-D-glucosidase BglC (GH1 family)
MSYRRPSAAKWRLASLFTVILASLSAGIFSARAHAQLPTAQQVAGQIQLGWNIGNTLEAICSETAWGNPMVTQQYVNAVKAAGFNAVRIPVAWDCHSTNGTINSNWIARVKQVVDYAYNQNMYVIINIHWDNGWLENNPFYSAQQAVNQKQNNYWTQIANYFKNYNERLLFAGTNEVHADYGTPTTEYITVQQSYNQTFVNAVRATGGNNSSRTLVVQTYNTNPQFGLDYFSLPSDSASNRLMVEIHYYDPYDFTLNPNGPCLAWGAPYPQYSQCSWAQESYVDNLFSRVKNKWVNAGVPVMIGEYGAFTRSGMNQDSRAYWHEYTNRAAKVNGIKTFLWDTGGVINRNTGAVSEQHIVDAIKRGYNYTGGGGSGIIANGTYRIVARHSGKVLDVAGAATNDGANVHQWGYSGGNNQRWTVTHLGNNQYSIIGVQSGKALEVSNWGASNGANVQIWSYGGGTNQKWTISATSGGYYRLTPTHATNMALDVNGVSSADGANVQQWSWTGGNNQQWAFQAP